MKKLARNLLAVIGLISVVVASYSFVWPVIDAEGTVSEGSFREMKIGASKSEVTEILVGASSQRTSRLKLSGYVGEDGDYVPLKLIECDGGKIADADKWFLSYPGHLQERVELVFDSDKLISIRYTRSPFDP